MNVFLGIVIIILLGIFSVVFAQYNKSYPTVAGILELKEGESGYNLYLNNKPILHIDDFFANIEKIFQIKNTTVALIIRNTGGNAAPSDFARFVTIKSDGTYLISKEFEYIYTTEDPPQVFQNGDTIIVRMKSNSKPDFEPNIIDVIYEEGKIRKIFHTSKKKNMTESECHNYYTFYKDSCIGSAECLLETKGNFDICWPRVAISNFYYYSKDKRINFGLFESLCKKAKLVSYEYFRINVCRIR